MTEPSAQLPDGTRVVVRGGASDAEVAAIVAALAMHAERTSAPRTKRRSAWLQAALHEGLGAAPAAQPSDLHRRR